MAQLNMQPSQKEQPKAGKKYLDLWNKPCYNKGKEVKT